MKSNSPDNKNSFKYKHKDNYTIVKDKGDEKALVDPQQIIDVAQKSISTSKSLSTVPYKTAKGIKTGVVKAKKEGRAIATAVKTHKVGRYVAKKAVKLGVATTKTTLKTTATSTRDRILNLQVNKSVTTDTGIEAAKQGATYLRYIDNSKKAASNTVKTVRNIKNAPHNVKVAIKKSAQTAKKIAKAATSKGFLMIIVGFFALTILQSSINDSVAGALSVVSSTFSWLADDDDSLTDKDILNKYIKVIKDEVKDKQNEVDNVYNNFDCDRREWGSHDPIEEFRYMRFHNAPIDITTTDKYCQVLAMVTAKWYSEELLSDTPPDDLKLSKNKIRKMVDEYFDFEHHIEYDYCPHYWDCNHGTIMVGGDVNGTLYYNECYYCYWHGCKEITKWVEPKPGRTDYGNGDAWERDVHHMGVRHFCDNPNHKYLAGGVTNYSTTEVQTRLHFTDDEKAIYQMYYEEISDILK